MASSNLTRIARQFRAELIRIEQAEARRITTAHAGLVHRLRRELERLLRGLTVPESPDAVWLDSLPRYQAFAAQVDREYNQWVTYTADVIQARQAELIALGEMNAQALVALHLPAHMVGMAESFGVIPTRALTELVGSLQQGSPLLRLKDVSAETTDKIARGLIHGLANGQHPTVVARSITDGLSVNASRALTISRTELLRAYRESSIASYAASPVVDGWVWVCAGDADTCAACWAMQGETFPDNESFGAHPNCRCTCVPNVMSLDSLGIDTTGLPAEDDLKIESGTDAFARQPEHVQRQVLGPARYVQYQRGELSLKDMVTTTHTADWGITRTIAPLKAA